MPTPRRGLQYVRAPISRQPVGRLGARADRREPRSPVIAPAAGRGRGRAGPHRGCVPALEHRPTASDRVTADGQHSLHRWTRIRQARPRRQGTCWVPDPVMKQSRHEAVMSRRAVRSIPMSDAFGPELPVTAAELWRETAAAPTLPTRPSGRVDDAVASAEAATTRDTPRESRGLRGDFD